MKYPKILFEITLIIVCVNSGASASVICTGDQCRQMLLDQSARFSVAVPAGSNKAASDAKVSDQLSKARNKAGVKDRIRISQAHAERVWDVEGAGNLPLYLANNHSMQAQDNSGAASGDLFMTFASKKVPLAGARAGSVMDAVVEQAILASPTTPNPITATITSGPQKGATILGEATFGKELKCILFAFNTLLNKDGTSTYGVKAVGIAPSGEACLEGQYESQNGRFFLAEMLTSGAAVMVDSQVQRSQNALGNYVEEPSLGNAAKKGLGAALSKSAEHAAEGMKTAPEFTKLSGFQPIRVIFQSDAVEN